jgi:nicotinamidase-related amidase
MSHVTNPILEREALVERYDLSRAPASEDWVSRWLWLDRRTLGRSVAFRRNDIVEVVRPPSPAGNKQPRGGSRLLMRPDPSPETAALLTIDVQCDFALPSSPAHIPGTLEAAQRIGPVADEFRAANRSIVHMVRLYLPDGSNAELPRRAYLEAGNQLVCPGTTGTEFLDELKPFPGFGLDADLVLSGEPQKVGAREWVMFKPRWGAFYGTTLEDRLRALDVGTVVICGCNSPTALAPRSTKRTSATSRSSSYLTRHPVSMSAG